MNAQQQTAITAPDGPVLVLAGPGSGKTRVLTHRIAWMLQARAVSPWQVLAVTFTNKAAREMRDRLAQMLGRDMALQMRIGTFHATCAHLLRREADAAGLSRDYLIFDTDDQLATMKRVVAELGLDDKRYRPAGLLNAISHAKNELISPDEYPVKTYYDKIVARAYVRYAELLRQSNALDFDDLLVEVVKLLRSDEEVLARYRQRYRYVLVDEFQDTNMAQYVIIRRLTQEHRSLFVVADEDQSIYSWRGADYRNIRRLREDYPELQTVLLEENYRSTQVILDAAQAVIARNTDRTPKHLFTRQQGGVPLHLHEAYDEDEEAHFVVREIQVLQRDGYAYGDIAIMYRTNAQSRALEETLVRWNIPYRLIGGTRFYSRREIKDVLAFMRLALNPDDDVSFLRVINVPRRGIGQQTLASVTRQAEQMGSCHYLALFSLLESETLGARAQRALGAFAELVDSWHAAQETLSVVELLDRILADTDFEHYLKDGTEEGESRWENVLSLRAVAADNPEVSLVDFLTEVALVADVDELSETVDAVTLLTLHGAKGLEYPAVFITGLEEKLLPHSRSMDSPDDLAEERRLCYVGMTRAKQRLYLTYAFRRGWYGNYEPTLPSRFLDDIPAETLGQKAKAKSPAPTATATWTPSWGGGGRPAPRAAAIERRFQAGQRVRHARFGEGVVQESAIEGGDEIVTVLFLGEGVGAKQLLAGVAPLEALPEH